MINLHHTLLGRVKRDAETSARRVRNGLLHVSGLSRPAVAHTPRDPVWRQDKARLWRYRSGHASPGPPVLIVMSLVSRPYIFDLAPGNSVVERLLDEGLDVYMLDWGVTDELDAGKTLETYCDHILPEAVRQTAATAGTNRIAVFGYCLGGVVALLSVAGNRDLPVGALVTLATPVDFSAFSLVSALARNGQIDPETLLDHTGNVPAAVVHNAIRSLAPTRELTSWVNLLQHLDNDEYLIAHQRMTQWASEHIPFAGAAFLQAIELLVRDNSLMSGKVQLGGRIVDLTAIDLPVMNVTAQRDHIVPPESTAPLLSLVRAKPATELSLPGGHIGLVVGRRAQRHNVPAIATWIHEQGAPA